MNPHSMTEKIWSMREKMTWAELYGDGKGPYMEMETPELMDLLEEIEFSKDFLKPFELAKMIINVPSDEVAMILIDIAKAKEIKFDTVSMDKVLIRIYENLNEFSHEEIYDSEEKGFKDVFGFDVFSMADENIESEDDPARARRIVESWPEYVQERILKD